MPSDSYDEDGAFDDGYGSAGYDEINQHRNY